MLGHLGINVPDLRMAKHYYDALMPLVGFEMQRRRLNAARVREHAIGGGDDIGFDTKGADHPAFIRGCPS